MRPLKRGMGASIHDARTREAVMQVESALLAVNDALARVGQGYLPTGGGNTPFPGITDHGLLSGLGDDDHSQYLLLAGRGGQDVADDITVDSLTSDEFVKVSQASTSSTAGFQGVLGTFLSSGSLYAPAGLTLSVHTSATQSGDSAAISVSSRNVSQTALINYSGEMRLTRDAVLGGTGGYYSTVSGATMGWTSGGTNLFYILGTSSRVASFALTGLTASTTRTYTLPDASGTILLTPLTTRGDLLTRDASAHVRLPIGTAGEFLRTDGADPSWQPIYEEDVDRNVASVFGRVHQAETVDAEWTFPGNGASRSIIIDSSDNGGGTDDGLGLFITDTTISGFGVKLCANDTMASDIVVKLPAASGTVISNTETITVTNKRLGTGTVLRCGSSGPPDTAGCLFGKGTSTTTGFRFDLSAITTSTIRDKTVQDKSGTDPVIVAPSSATTNKTGQTGSIAATTVYATGTPGAGLYRADVYGVVTARTTTGTMLVDILYTDPAAAQTVSIPTTVGPIAMGAAVGQNFQGSLVFYANASTNIQFQTTHTGTYTYSLWVRITALT